MVEVDDSMDEDTLAVLLDPNPPAGFSLCNTDVAPGILFCSFISASFSSLFTSSPSLGSSGTLANVQFITVLRRVEWDVSSGHLNQKLSALFHNLYSSVMFKLRYFSPCYLTGLRLDVQLPEEDQVILFPGVIALVVFSLLHTRCKF